MEMKVLFGGMIMLGGWLWFYLFVRQFLFDFFTAYPLIKGMLAADEELISTNARRYTTVSVILCAVVSAIIAVVVILLCKTYLIICFFVGALIAMCMFIGRLSPKNRSMFDSFCAAYYRFVPDDELRTAMYNKKPSQMKKRLHEMKLSTEFIPEFKN